MVYQGRREGLTRSGVSYDVDVFGKESLGVQCEQGGEGFLLGKISTGSEDDDDGFFGESISGRFHGWDGTLFV